MPSTYLLTCLLTHLQGNAFILLEIFLYQFFNCNLRLLTTESYNKIKNGNQIPQVRISNNKRKNNKQTKEEYQYGAVSTSANPNTAKVKVKRSSLGGQTSGYVIGILTYSLTHLLTHLLTYSLLHYLCRCTGTGSGGIVGCS